MTKVAEQFEVSGSYMARVCVALNVPRPERGYWAKLAVGKAPTPDPMPEARPGDQLFWTRGGELLPPPRPEYPPRRTNLARAHIPKERIHPLIHGAKELFEAGRPVEDGAYLKPYKKLLVDVTTSNACLDKTLGFANDLFNALESAGHRVVMAPSSEKLRGYTIDEREDRAKARGYHHSNLWSPYRPTVVYIGAVAIGVAVIEMSEEVLLRYVRGNYIRDSDYVPPKQSRHFVDHTWTTTRDMPCGRLRLVTYSPYWRVPLSTDWQETRKTSLASALKSIVKTIEASAAELVTKLEEADRKAEIAHLEYLAAEEKRRKEEDRRRAEQSVRDSKEHLGQIIHQWSSVLSIERFLTGVEERAALLTGDERVQVLQRLQLAREFLGTQDPLDFFMSWKTPVERYRPLYGESDLPRN